MANEEHLKILRQGVEVWNEWRKNNPFVVWDPEFILDGGVDNVYDADLSGANLSGTNLEEANLNFVNLNGVNLSKATLSAANLSESDLSESDLSGAELINTNLEDARLEGANLWGANLSTVRALGTNFRGATLTGSLIEDWHINTYTNLSDVVCDYVYLKNDWETKQRSERRPHTGTFAPGEFAKLVQSTLNTIDLIFNEGLDWKAFAYSFKQVEVLHEDAHLEVRSIENKGDGVVIVKVASAPGVDKALIHSDFMKGYEFAAQAIAAQYEARLLDKDNQLAQQGTQINQLFGLLQHAQERLGEVPKLMAEQRSGDTNYYGDIKAVNFTPHGTATGGVYNDFSNTQDLAQAAAQIQSLLAQLQQQGHSPEAAQQQVADDLAEQAKKDPTTLGKLMMWGQKLGDATITDVVKGVVKLALRSAGVPLP